VIVFEFALVCLVFVFAFVFWVDLCVRGTLFGFDLCHKCVLYLYLYLYCLRGLGATRVLGTC
jgi:hypothetical protein